MNVNDYPMYYYSYRPRLVDSCLGKEEVADTETPLGKMLVIRPLPGIEATIIKRVTEYHRETYRVPKTVVVSAREYEGLVHAMSGKSREVVHPTAIDCGISQVKLIIQTDFGVLSDDVISDFIDWRYREELKGEQEHKEVHSSGRYKKYKTMVKLFSEQKSQQEMIEVAKMFVLDINYCREDISEAVEEAMRANKWSE